MTLGPKLAAVLAAFVAILVVVIVMAFRERRLGRGMAEDDTAAQRRILRDRRRDPIGTGSGASGEDQRYQSVARVTEDRRVIIEGKLCAGVHPGCGQLKGFKNVMLDEWSPGPYRRELERSGVLVVGPNPVFMDYISHVLPMLGEERVEQRSIDELGTGVAAALGSGSDGGPAPEDARSGARVVEP